MHFQVVIVGAGPAGLACAKILSQSGIRTLVIEKKETIGSKVCAGGLTWGGLAGSIPENLIERSFSVQYIKTPFQHISVQSPHPIIVTVNREKLGQFMLEQAIAGGAEILAATRVIKISEHDLILQQSRNNQQRQIRFDFLVGADGSNSLVRRFLALPSSLRGIGINYQIPGNMDKMEWHLESSYFKNGYGWIFPHRETVSVGAYVDGSVIDASVLKKNLIKWAKGKKISLTDKKCRAEYINFDYQGWNFGHIFLAGDAAGLASALTGEGIYPAIVSGEMVARKIINPDCDHTPINSIIKKQRIHARMVHLTGKNRIFNTIFRELMVLGLRSGILDFSQLEMTD
jgi:menaquinone-9 beta-reductase